MPLPQNTLEGEDHYMILVLQHGRTGSLKKNAFFSKVIWKPDDEISSPKMSLNGLNRATFYNSNFFV